MQEFDPRRPTLRFAPKILVAVGGFAVLGLCWNLTGSPAGIVAQPLDAAALAALQHIAFARAAAQPSMRHHATTGVE